MKKIGILTFHRALNYGAILQTYALQQKLKILFQTDEIYVIDYRCTKIEKNRSFTNVIKNGNIFKGIYLLWKKIKFIKFERKYINLSPKKYDSKNYIEIDNDFDYIIVGSDQVWNLKITGNDKTYFLNFVKDNTKKISYAASMGNSKFDNEEQILNLINSFNGISVRENETKKYFEEKNIKNVNVNIDPTLTLNLNEIEKNCNKKTKKNEKYILTYNIKKPQKMYVLAEKLSKEKKLKVYAIPTAMKSVYGKRCFPNITEFINLFKNSEYVITNSFHGTVFSILFHKKMLVELDPSGNGNERIISLLKLFGLEERIMDNDYMKIDNDINWNNVEKILMKENQKVDKYLKSNII